MKIEHILLSISVVHENEIIQYDDSCAHLIEKYLQEYNGVRAVKTEVHYKHGSTETHGTNCECYFCTDAKRPTPKGNHPMTTPAEDRA